ncbi:hypothetical protein ASG54_18050 [Aureimonas sp. Leaf460]|nr:hypothetical protein ASG62_22985 [Aureimonas sp. Leaf427]KQT73215.1 hypothetical protein ASG54_18050 [Aureimonas sp. Leaf460]
MTTAKNLMNAMDTALDTARAEYRNAVLALATDEERKHEASNRQPANVDSIHHARTRVIALDAAREELARVIEEGASLSSTS